MRAGLSYQANEEKGCIMTSFTIKPMAPTERNYCYSWGPHLMAASGCIGHLRGDMGSEGKSFYATWFDHQEDLKTQAFKDELDAVVNALRFDPACGGALASRGKLAAYCCAHPESGMGTITREYGFRVDTQDHAYMLRLNPNRGEYNFYVYCYVRERLDRHMEDAKRGIRFVTSGYRDLFRLADGDRIRIVSPDGKHRDHICRYISETHMTCGWDDRLYHIHDFAEEMEKAGNVVVPLRSSLPEKCFAALEATGEVVVIHRGAKGYTPTGQRQEGTGGQESADELNGQIGVTKAQAAAMLTGSMFGWDCPGADPANYDAEGRPVRKRP